MYITKIGLKTHTYSNIKTMFLLLLTCRFGLLWTLEGCRFYSKLLKQHKLNNLYGYSSIFFNSLINPGLRRYLVKVEINFNIVYICMFFKVPGDLEGKFLSTNRSNQYMWTWLPILQLGDDWLPGA